MKKGIVKIALSIIVMIIILIALFGNWQFDFSSGSHRITPTAVDNDIWGNYKVYYRTSQYTQNTQEDFYYIDKANKELADQTRECIKQGKDAIVYYDKYIGFKGITAPATSPIIKIEIIEE